MNRIVLEHYPTSRLPSDLRDAVRDAAEVRLTIEVLLPSAQQADVGGDQPAPKPGLFSQYRHLAKARFTSDEEIVEHVRVLRDEWDHRDR